MSRILRTLFCFLLICCILINCFPIKAKATLVSTSAVVSVAVKPVVVSLIKGLGVAVAANVTSVAFEPVVDACIAHLQNLGLCQEYSINVFGYNFNGISVFGVTPALIEAVRAWLFDSGTVKETTLVSTTGFSVSTVVSGSNAGPGYYCVSKYFPALLKTAYDSNLAMVFGCSADYLLGCFWGDDGRLYHGTWQNGLGISHSSVLGCYDLSELTLVSSACRGTDVFYSKSHAEAQSDWLTKTYYAIDWTGSITGSSAGSYGYLTFSMYSKKSVNSVWDASRTSYSLFFYSNDGTGTYTRNGYYPGFEDAITWGSGTSTSITVSEGLQLEQIAPQEQTLQEGYSRWYDNSLTVQDPTTEEKVTVLPIPQVYTYEDALSIPQQQIWQGTTTGVGTDTGTGSGTGSDSGTSSDTWIPPVDPGAFSLDLTNYFPFCIPFDLYDFFSCLNSDPVAPVINWEIPIPGGGSYALVLDLSAFDSVAQLLRRLELLLFCIGLAVKTRDLIKG